MDRLRASSKTLQSSGSFAGLADLIPYPEINDFLAADFRARQNHES